MPLTGRKILEIADEKGVYCGKLFADLGAEVIKIEPVAGDATRDIPPFWKNDSVVDGKQQSLFFLYMNTSKKSVAVDIYTEQGQTLIRQLAAEVDLIIETLPPGKMAALGLSYKALSAINPQLVVTSISGFGQTGPYRDYKTSELVANAMGGSMVTVGHEDDAPVKLAGSQAYVMASTLAACSSMVALRHCDQSGEGQAVDISVQEVMLAVSSICGVGKWLEDGVISNRYGGGLFTSVPSGIYPCKDGKVYLIVNRLLHWKTLAGWVSEVTGNEEILDPMFEGPSLNRMPYRELLDLFISELTKEYTVEDFYREAQARHLAVTPLSTATTIIEDKHLNQRQFFQQVSHANGKSFRYPGAPYRFSLTPWSIKSVAPDVGGMNSDDLFKKSMQSEERPERNKSLSASNKPLAGLRVVEFTAGMAGPWIGRILSYNGAEIIKVESKKYPDVTRLYIPPKTPELGIQSQMSPWLTDWNAGKKSVSLDLTKPEAVELAKDIVKQSDIVIDNNGAGVLKKLGLGFDKLEKLKPELILFDSTGFGNKGPDASYISWGPNIETLSGLAALSGYKHRDCTMTQFAYPDPLSGLHGFFAILSAIEYKNKTGKGQSINMSQLEATIACMGDVMLEVLANNAEPEKLANASLNQLQGCYPCAGDDRWCVLTVSSEEEWKCLCSVLDKNDWLDDPRFSDLSLRLKNQNILDVFISNWTKTQTPHQVMDRLQQAGIAAGAVQDVEDQWLRDPHLKSRQFFEEIKHHKKDSVWASGIPMGLTKTPGKTIDAGRARGFDNREVFCDLLALSTEQYESLLAAEIIEAIDC